MNYSTIKPVDVANGTGVRVSIFCCGCPHHCPGCFNSELWDPNAGKPFTAETMNQILDLCEPDHISGLSLLGGEPLCVDNIVGMIRLCRQFKHRFPDKTIWCYTGYIFEQLVTQPIMNYIDILVDGQFKEELKDPRLKFRGSSNQRIIDVQKSLFVEHPFLRKDLME